VALQRSPERTSQVLMYSPELQRPTNLACRNHNKGQLLGTSPVAFVMKSGLLQSIVVADNFVIGSQFRDILRRVICEES
jgi:hypothetical protein